MFYTLLLLPHPVLWCLCFQYIENLEKLKKLRALNLGHNMIEKIEKLEKLPRLQELNLEDNNIKKIEGIETLGNLQTLNLSGNNLETLPAPVFRRLQRIQDLRLANNKLTSVS